MNDKPIRIAITDDHILVRSGISNILDARPEFKVVQQASNGQELLDGIATSQPELVLLDIEMPVLSGRQTLVRLKKEYPDIKVLMLTMHDNSAFIVQMMDKLFHRAYPLILTTSMC